MNFRTIIVHKVRRSLAFSFHPRFPSVLSPFDQAFAEPWTRFSQAARIFHFNTISTIFTSSCTVSRGRDAVLWRTKYVCALHVAIVTAARVAFFFPGCVVESFNVVPHTVVWLLV